MWWMDKRRGREWSGGKILKGDLVHIGLKISLKKKRNAKINGKEENFKGEADHGKEEEEG